MRMLYSMTQLGFVMRWRMAGAVVFAAVFLLLCSDVALVNAAPPRHILFLHAHTEEFPAHKMFENGFKKQLQLAGETSVEYSYDYLELTKFSSNPRYSEQLAAFYKQKYALKQPDLIVTHLGPAADFALKYGREIFPKAQFLLAADEVEGVSNHELPPGFGGVTGIFNVKHTIGLILQLQPDVRKIYVAIGDSERERQTMMSFRSDVAAMSAEVEFVYLNAMTLPQMVETVRNLREKAAVMYVFVFKDAAGNVFIPANEVKTFSEAASVPVYIPYSVFMGRGAVGGYLMSTEILGMKAAEQGLARLRTQGGPSMPVEVQNAEYQFDWRALQRWGIPESKLPPGSKVLFKERTVWEQYWGYIVGGLALIAFLGFLVIGLLVNRSLRRRSEQKLLERTQELDFANETLTALNEEAIAMNEELTSSNEEIAMLNQDLEHRVAERTADLTAAHEELTAQYAEFRETQMILKEKETSYADLIANLSNGLALRDEAGLIIFANQAFADMVQVENFSNVIGMSYLDFVHPDDREGTRRRVAVSLQGQSVAWREHRLVGLQGRTIFVESTGVAMRQEGRPRIMGIFHDITERVRSEQEMRRDAQLATRVQNALLSMPESSDHIEMTTVYQPFSYVGGDLYFLDWRHGGNLLRGFLVDATGHGLGTALHTASLHVLLQDVNEHDLPLADAIRWLNRRAVEYFDDATFAGTLGFELDLETRQLRWVCAGIPEVWMATKKLQGAAKYPGLFLGIHEFETFETHTISVDVGDSFYFMTDGLSDLLKEGADLPLDRYAEMCGLLQMLSISEQRRDDATAICIHVRSFPDSLVRQDGWPRTLQFNGYGDYQRLKGEVAMILAEVTGKPHSLHEVAVNEALANAMECRDGVPRPHKARLRFNKIGNCLIVRVKSSRMGFAGNALLRRLRSQPEDMFSFGEDASMGRGIPMMLSMADKMTYNGEGTEVLLAWKL